MSQNRSRDANDSFTEDRATERPTRSPEDDLICPITRELLWDPVFATDGRIYERKAIEAHISFQKWSLKTSPVTNETMSDILYPCPRIKNLIKTLIETKMIVGELASKWSKKLAHEKQIAEIVEKANAGDGEAMWNLGLKYEKGTDGFEQNQVSAYEWFEKSHAAGFVPGTASLGWCLLHGIGTERKPAQGIMYTCLAAQDGSALAAYRLGTALKCGLHGLDKNVPEAIQWLEISLDPACQYKQDFSHETWAREYLNDLYNRLDEQTENVETESD